MQAPAIGGRKSAAALTALIDRVGLSDTGIRVSLKLPIPADEGRARRDSERACAIARFVPMRMKRRGVEMRLIIDGDAAPTARIDLPLLNATARAYRWSNDLLAGRARSIGEIARREQSYRPSRATRDAAGVSGAQDRRGDRRRAPACGPYHRSNDPKNRTAPALERARASSGHSIAHAGRVASTRSSWVRPGFPLDVGRLADGHAKIANREFCGDFRAQPRPVAFSGSTAARESRPTRRFHRFSKM